MHPVSSLIDGRPARAPVPAESTLVLSGKPLDARLPLALLEAVKAIDTPEAELDAELVHELRNKRLGLSDTVYQQIRRYSDAVRARQSVAFDEVLALARLIGRARAEPGFAHQTRWQPAAALQRLLPLTAGLRTHGLVHLAAARWRRRQRRHRQVSGYR
jgi:hypothetical protein